MRNEEKEQWQVLIHTSRVLNCIFFACISLLTSNIVIFSTAKYYYFFIFSLLVMYMILDCDSTIVTTFFTRYPICEFHFVLTFSLNL